MNGGPIRPALSRWSAVAAGSTAPALPAWLTWSGAGAFALVAALCLLPVALYAPFFSEPFENDEGTYATIAQGLMRGDVPYRDLFDHKPPLIYAWYALSFTVFGETVEAPRIMAALAWSAAGVFVWLTGRLVYGPRAAIAATALFSLAAGFPLLQANANTEAFLLLPLTASLWSFTKGLAAGTGSATRWMVLAGVLGGLAALTKQVAALQLVAFAVLLAWPAVRSGDWRGPARLLAWLFAGSMVPLAAALALFTGAGALDDFFYANVTYNRLYSSEMSVATRALYGAVNTLYAARAASLLSGVFLLALLAMRRRKLLPGEAAIIAGLGAAAAGIVLSGWFFPHYYVAVVPFAALAGGHFLARPRPERAERRVFRCTMAALAIAMLYVNLPIYLQPTPEARHTAKFVTGDASLQNAAPSLAAYIDENTNPGETIWEFGRGTQIYFYADREPAVRIMYDRPFWLEPASIDATIAGLEETKPALILDTITNSGVERVNGGSMPPQLRELLSKSYELSGHVEYADVYRLREPAPGNTR